MKAGRALLDWTQDDLANASGISVTTIRKLEVGFISPRPDTVQTIQKAMEGAGIEFLDGEGVRRRTEDLWVYVGEEGAIAFFNDVKQTIGKVGGEVLLTTTTEATLAQICGSEEYKNLAQILKQNDTSKIKCLLTEASEPALSTPRFEFRSLSKNYVDTISFFVYGDKHAILVLGYEPFPKIIVAQSVLTAQSFRRQFYSMWDKSSAFLAAQPASISSKARFKK